MAFSLWLLGSSADAYLSPALEHISETIKLQEAVAGVTLLALGNGASDVFSAIAAGSSGGAEGNLNLVVAFLIGTVMLLITVVLGLIVRASKKNGEVLVTKGYFLRELSFLLLT